MIDAGIWKALVANHDLQMKIQTKSDVEEHRLHSGMCWEGCPGSSWNVETDRLLRVLNKARRAECSVEWYTAFSERTLLHRVAEFS